MINENQAPLNSKINNSEDEGIDFKRILILLLDKWYWLLICTILGVGIGLLSSKIKQQQFYTDSTILIPSNDSGSNLGSIFEKSIQRTFNYGSEIFNEIDVLQSYTLSHKAIENLNWRTAWYEKGLFKWKGLYNHEPYSVQELGSNNNIEGIDIQITPINSTQYKIQVEGKAKINSIFKKVDFKATGIFGKAFTNQYFSFILHKKDKQDTLLKDHQFKFRFLNAQQLTNNYRKRLTIEQTSKRGDVLKLSIQGAEPLRNIHYLNELVQVYMNRKLELSTETRKRTLNFITNQLAGISDSLQHFGSNFSKFRSDNQIINISAQGELVMDQLSKIENQRSQQKMQLSYFKNLLNYLKNSQRIQQMASPSVVGVQDAGLNSLVLALSQLYSQREIISFSARENNPRLVLLNKEIDQTTRQLRSNLLNLIDNANLAIKALTKQYDAINQQLNHLPIKEQQYINIKQQYELTNQVYTFLLQKKSETEIALAATVVNVQVIDPAQIERVKRVGLSSQKFILASFILGLFIPIFIIIGIDLIDNRIQLQEDVEKHTNLSIIGNVLHRNQKSELVVVSDPTAPISESFRTIRTNLQYKLTRQNDQVIGIHSIRPGEGKSFTSTNLASILAMNNKKTLLIGADIRKPRLHQIFKLKHNPIGLSSYLIGKNTIDEIICPTNVQHLDLVASGPIPPNPAELLENGQLDKLLNKAKEEYDYIIIDNAPVSMVTDGQITGKLSDLNLFVLRYGISRKEELKFINELANKGTLPNIALVINDIKAAKIGYSYGYGYGSGYKYAYNHQKRTKLGRFSFKKKNE